MPYLNIDLDFFRHPKTLMLEAELGGHRATLLPIKLWAYVGKYHFETGILKGYSPAALAKAIDADIRFADKIIAALVKCGFLVKKKDGYQVHGWTEHNGHLALFRERARTAALARWNKSKVPDQESQNEAVKPGKQAKPALDLKEDEIQEIRGVLAKTCRHRLISDANETAWKDLKEKLEKAAKSKKIENMRTYAITAAMNYGKAKP